MTSVIRLILSSVIESDEKNELATKETHDEICVRLCVAFRGNDWKLSD